MSRLLSNNEPKKSPTQRSPQNVDALKTNLRGKDIQLTPWVAPSSIAIAPSTIPVGKIKSFGPFGPKYEVGKPLHLLDDGDWMVEVTMVETGEKAEYRLTRLSDDPEAH